MLGKIGIMELIVIFAIVLLVVGPKRLPQVGEALGSAIRSFKKGSKEIQESFEAEDEAPAPTKAAPTTLKAEPVQTETTPSEQGE